MLTLRRPLRKVRQALLAAAALSAVVSALGLALPAFVLQLLGTAMPAGSVETLQYLCAAAVASFLAIGLLDLARSLILLRSGLWLEHAVGARFVQGCLARGATGEQLRETASALEAVRCALVGRGLPAALELPWLFVCLALLVFIDIRLAAVCLTISSFAFVVSRFAAGRSRGRRLARDHAREWIEAIAPSSCDLGAMGAAKGLALRWEAANRSRIAKSWHVGRRSSVSVALIRALAPASVAVVLAYGAYLAITASLAPAAAVAASLMVYRAMLAIEQLASGGAELREGRAGWRVLTDVDKWLGQAGHRNIASHGNGRLELEGVSTIDADGEPALQNVSLAIAPGSAVGVVGVRGAGKTSLVRAIVGAAEAVSGEISLGGRSLADVQRSMTTRMIGYVPDRPMLLPGTVAENICGFEEMQVDAIEAAANKAGVRHIIEALPCGLGTLVGQDGRGVTCTEARAIALARALYGAPRIVVLDEPEGGAEDAEVARLIATLQRLRADGITIVIATNDTRLLRVTDDVVLLNAGTVEARVPSQQIAGFAAPQSAPSRDLPRAA